MGGTNGWKDWAWRCNEKHVQKLLETCKPLNSPLTAEDYKNVDWKKKEF